MPRSGEGRKLAAAQHLALLNACNLVPPSIPAWVSVPRIHAKSTGFGGWLPLWQLPQH